jgi:16S rRNA (uracil1498-N3)-methyltransferase
MEPPIFYAPPQNVIGNIIHLPGEEARHAVSVMRLHRGDVVMVVDGAGMAYRGELAELSRGKVTLHIHSTFRNFGEPSVRLTLAAGLSAGEKFDSVVEKGTELGVKRFVPVISSKSKVRLESDQKVRSRVRRLERVALAAMKQCRRSYLPEIAVPLGLAQFLVEQNDDDLKLLFHLSPDGQGLENIDLAVESGRVTILVGPESGFSDPEVDMARGSGFVQLYLGSRVLRTETAAPVAVALVLQKLGEFS